MDGRNGRKDDAKTVSLRLRRGITKAEGLTLSLLEVAFMSAENLCKHFGPRSGPTECRS